MMMITATTTARFNEITWEFRAVQLLLKIIYKYLYYYLICDIN